MMNNDYRGDTLFRSYSVSTDNGHTGKRTITFKASTYNLLNADDIAIATNKGWTIASR